MVERRRLVASLSKNSIMVISGSGIAAIAAGLGLTTMAGKDQPANGAPREEAQAVVQEPSAPQQDETSSSGATDDEATSNESNDEPADAASGGADIVFTRGSLSDLVDAQLAGVIKKLESVPGVSDTTKVWIADADVASAPGVERIFHIKGPLTCGSAGCDLIVTGGGHTLLETIGEGIDCPEIDTLVINQGTALEAAWVFNGETFVEK